MGRSAATARPTALRPGPGVLERAAVEVAIFAADQPTSAYAGTYKQFLAYLSSLHGGTVPEAFGVLEVCAYRDWLIGSGADSSAVAWRLKAVRRLAQHLGLEPAIARVRSRPLQPCGVTRDKFVLERLRRRCPEPRRAGF